MSFEKAASYKLQDGNWEMDNWQWMRETEYRTPVNEFRIVKGGYGSKVLRSEGRNSVFKAASLKPQATS